MQWFKGRSLSQNPLETEDSCILWASSFEVSTSIFLLLIAPLILLFRCFGFALIELIEETAVIPHLVL